TARKSTSTKPACSQRPVADRGDRGRGGDSDYPRPDNSSRNSPSHGREAIGRAGTHDRAGDRVSGAHWNPVMRRETDRQCPPGLGRESANGGALAISLDPMVSTILQPPNKVPSEIA